MTTTTVMLVTKRLPQIRRQRSQRQSKQHHPQPASRASTGAAVHYMLTLSKQQIAANSPALLSCLLVLAYKNHCLSQVNAPSPHPQQQPSFLIHTDARKRAIQFHTNTHRHSQTHSQTHTHRQTQTQTHTQTHSQTRTHCLSVCVCLFVSLSFSLCFSLPPPFTAACNRVLQIWDAGSSHARTTWCSPWASR